MSSIRGIFFRLGSVLLATVLVAANVHAAAKRFVIGYETNNDAVITTVANAGGTVAANYPQIGVIIADSDNPGFAAAVKADPNFRFVAEDMVVPWIEPNIGASGFETLALAASAPAGDPRTSPWLFKSRQWNIPIVKADLAWDVTLGSPAVKVAVLDTGICAHHVDLAGKVDAAQSASFVPPASEVPLCSGCPDWEDRYFHGTHVAGIITSNNVGTAGIAPNVRLRAVKVCNYQGSCAFSWIIAGIMYAANTGNDVINMSLAAYFPKNGGPGPGSLGSLVAAANKAINYAESQGVLVVSAAGNSGSDLNKDGNYVVTPCQSGSGLCVGATTSTDELADYSNHGLSGPQIVAPGGGSPSNLPSPYMNILSPCSRHSVVLPVCGADPNITYWLWASGTSMAAPHVAGAAALVDSVAKGGPGSARGGQLRNALLNGADDLGKPGADNIFSKGRLNVLEAVRK